MDVDDKLGTLRNDDNLLNNLNNLNNLNAACVKQGDAVTAGDSNKIFYHLSPSNLTTPATASAWMSTTSWAR